VKDNENGTGKYRLGVTDKNRHRKNDRLKRKQEKERQDIKQARERAQPVKKEYDQNWGP